MKKILSFLLIVMLAFLVQGCAVYTPYAPVGYSYPAYGYGYRPGYYNPGHYGWVDTIITAGAEQVEVVITAGEVIIIVGSQTMQSIANFSLYFH